MYKSGLHYFIKFITISRSDSITPIQGREEDWRAPIQAPSPGPPPPNKKFLLYTGVLDRAPLRPGPLLPFLFFILAPKLKAPRNYMETLLGNLGARSLMGL